MSVWDRKGQYPMRSHEFERITFSKMFLSAEALRDSLNGTKKLSPSPEENPHTIIPSAPKFTRDTMQSGKCCSPGNCQTQFSSWERQTKRQDSVPHVNMPVLYTTVPDTWHWI
ncbi:hypothetical protein XENOCAPTIV_003061 [Xenoophorus captivus]|uniref:Uncharacterized protein n=1 Tax=Xenoophorus captivus TaxID=1517983 RepID=A0ABV0R6I6_9TELE